jgi:hypothetical protein
MGPSSQSIALLEAEYGDGKGPLYWAILDVMLECPRGAKGIAEAIGLIDPKEPTADDPQILKRIHSILATIQFNKDLAQARTDIAGATVERFRRKAPWFATQLENLAKQDTDMRVKYQAVKDGLDRAGTAPTINLTVGPTAYREAVAPLLEDEPEPPKALTDGNGDAGPTVS